MEKLLEYRFIFKRAENEAEAKPKRKTLLSGLGIAAFLFFAASVDFLVDAFLRIF